MFFRSRRGTRRGRASHEDRVSHNGASFANRLNGNVSLQADVSVFDDGAKDVLTASAGQDWFRANLNTGVEDKITDMSANEFANDPDFINS
jgi:hypothetical protein